MKRALLFALGVGLSQVANGAVGTAAVDTWYARPATECANNGDGLAYNCAASAGAPGAFQDLDNFIWTSTTGIDDGDRVKLCHAEGSAFTQAAANTANSNLAMMQISGSGPASYTGRIVITGDCAAEGGARIATIDGDYTSGSVIRTRENIGLEFYNLDLSGAKDAGMTLYLSAPAETATAKYIYVDDSVTVHDIKGGTGKGITWSGTKVDLGSAEDWLEVYDVDEDAFFEYSGGDHDLIRLKAWSIGLDGTDVDDCIQLQRFQNGTRVIRPWCDKSERQGKQCFVASTMTQSDGTTADETQSYSFLGGYCKLAGGTVSNCGYFDGRATVDGMWCENPGNAGFVVGLNNSRVGTFRSNIVLVENGTAVGIQAARTSAGGKANAIGNTLLAHGLGGGRAFDFNASTAAHDVRNNIIAGNWATGIYRGASGTADDYNDVFGPAIPYSDNGVTGSASANDLAVDPAFIGGNRPTSPYGFRPTNPEVCTGAVAARGASWDGQRFRQGGQIGAMACRSDAIR